MKTEVKSTPRVTIFVLTYGNFPGLARQTIESVFQWCDRRLYRLVVGANAVCEETRHYLQKCFQQGKIDRLHISETNLNKCPMMRQMFDGIETDYIWWFDDDSYIQEASALQNRLKIADEAPPEDVLWGHVFFFGNEIDFSYGTDVTGFVKSASWYKGLEPPSWEPGGKGETDFEGWGCGDGRWFFVTGGNWWMRSHAVRALDWPDPNLIKRNDDVFLCEAIRQQGWNFSDIGSAGVAINTEPRRGWGEDAVTMEIQMSRQLEEPDLDGWFFPEEAAVYRQLASEFTGGTVVELGVWKGKSIASILDICREKKHDLVAIDHWDPDPNDPDYADTKEKDIHQVFVKNLHLLGHSDTVRIIREDTANAARHFADKSVDLVFLDADDAHESVKKNLLAWIPKIKKDGVLLGHDYCWKEGVRTALATVLPGRFKLLSGSLWQMLPEREVLPPTIKGCIFLPTFQDTNLLVENFHNRPELSQSIDIHVFDDNFEPRESKKIKQLCVENGWNYHKHRRPVHGNWMEENHDLRGFNRFVWESMVALGEQYDYVLKLDTDTYVVEPDFYHEFAHVLSGEPAIAGTIEYRPTRDVIAFWTLAASYGYTYQPGDWVAHMQGGIYGLNKKALKMLKEMPFLEGRHTNFAEDGYMSYACLLLGIKYLPVYYSGSWWHPYRPNLAQIDYLKAIHPLLKTEWLHWRNGQ